jgi:hypothetical protein
MTSFYVLQFPVALPNAEAIGRLNLRRCGPGVGHGPMSPARGFGHLSPLGPELGADRTIRYLGSRLSWFYVCSWFRSSFNCLPIRSHHSQSNTSPLSSIFRHPAREHED